MRSLCGKVIQPGLVLPAGGAGLRIRANRYQGINQKKYLRYR